MLNQTYVESWVLDVGGPVHPLWGAARTRTQVRSHTHTRMFSSADSRRNAPLCMRIFGRHNDACNIYKRSPPTRNRRGARVVVIIDARRPRPPAFLRGPPTRVKNNNFRTVGRANPGSDKIHSCRSIRPRSDRSPERCRRGVRTGRNVFVRILYSRASWGVPRPLRPPPPHRAPGDAVVATHRYLK